MPQNEKKTSMIRKISLLAILIVSLFFIASCDKVFNLGKDTIPNGDLLNVNICDTVQVNLKTKKMFHQLTTGGQYFLYDYAPKIYLGEYDDPVFGPTKSEFMTEVRQIYYPNWIENKDSVSTFDSLCLLLPIDTTDFFYSNSTSNTLNLSVYQLNDTLNHYMFSDQDPSLYFNESDLLGQGITNKIKIINKDTIGGYDTTFLELKLSDTYGKYLFDNAQTIFYNSDTYFHFKFKGLYVKVNNSNTGIYKIMVNNTINFRYSGLIVYFHYSKSQHVARKFVLPISTECGRVNLFSHDYIGTYFEQQLQDSTIELQNAYVQSMAGTFVKVDIPGIKNFKNVIINKAELIIKSDKYLTSIYKPNPTLYLIGLDSANKIFEFNDFFNSNYIGASYADGVYSFNITRIIQNIIDGVYNYDEKGLYLIDLSSYSNFYRVVLYNYLSATPSKLIITYTKID